MEPGSSGSNRASNGVLSNCSFCEEKASFAHQFFTAPPPLGSTRILDDVAIFLEKMKVCFTPMCLLPTLLESWKKCYVHDFLLQLRVLALALALMLFTWCFYP